MDTDCEHTLEEMDGYVFCVECGLEIGRFLGFSSGCKKKVKKYYCNKSFLKDSGLKRHLKNHV